MSNDLIELTDTELDTVSGGKHHPGLISLGNIVTQVNVNDQSAAIVALSNTGSINQTAPQQTPRRQTGAPALWVPLAVSSNREFPARSPGAGKQSRIAGRGPPGCAYPTRPSPR